MDRDTFIITVYCLVVDFYKMVKEKYKIRRGGFLPSLTDEEVITIEICGAYFKLHSDKDLFNYFQSHYQNFFPNLKDRPSFVRQSANLRQICGKSKEKSGNSFFKEANKTKPQFK